MMKIHYIPPYYLSCFVLSVLLVQTCNIQLDPPKILNENFNTVKSIQDNLGISLFQLTFSIELTRLKVLELAKLTIHAYGFSTVA